MQEHCNTKTYSEQNYQIAARQHCAASVIRAVVEARESQMRGEIRCDVRRWYAVHTHPKQEDRVDSNLRTLQVETFSPKLKKRHYHQRLSRPVTLSKCLFPGYIFARFEASHSLHKVSFTRGVHNVVSFGDGPAPIGDEVIALIKSYVAEDGFVRIGEELKQGDAVIIEHGPFKNITGIFERAMKATDRIMILLTAVNYQGHIGVEKELIKRIDPLLPVAANVL